MYFKNENKECYNINVKNENKECYNNTKHVNEISFRFSKELTNMVCYSNEHIDSAVF